MRLPSSSLSLPLALIACGSAWEPPAPRDAPAVSVEPLGELGAAPAVLRLRVSGAVGRSSLADFRVFEGELSTYHLGRLRRRDVPGTLLEREVGSVVWAEGPDIVVAPGRALGAGTYSLASPELGLLAEVTVEEELVPWLERVWPPRARPNGRGTMIFRGAEAFPIDAGEVLLAPAGVAARVEQGLGGDASFEGDCVRVEPSEAVADGVLLLPPALVGGVALEPAPLVVGAVATPEVTCEPDWVRFGAGCVRVEDDRARLRAPVEPSFWALTAPEQRTFVLEPGRSAVLRGLEPEQPVHLAATVFALDGTSERVVLDVRAGVAEEHVVINEVLANPVGPERTGEWVELVNDGREPVALGDLELRDSTGGAPLPNATLDPGELALLVGEGFAPDPELDLVAPAGVKRLVVPALGSAGLANSGEALRLVDREGRVLSRFPAVAAGKAGQSIARVRPEAADDEAASFVPHGPPGASPGAPNVVEAPP